MARPHAFPARPRSPAPAAALLVAAALLIPQPPAGGPAGPVSVGPSPLASLLGPAPALAAPQSAAHGGELVRQIDRIVERALEEGPVAGISVAVAHGTGFTYAKGYGYADLEHRVPATAETVYRVGSVTKQFTAAAVLQLAAEGQVDLHAPLSRYLDGYPGDWSGVTLHHVLSMTSGIPNYTALRDRWRSSMREDLDHGGLIEVFASEPPDFEPGTAYRYSNSGYYLAGVVVEEASGTSFDRYLEERVFGPAGARDARYCHNRPLIPRRARGYQRAGGELVNASYISMNTPGGAGAVCASVLDLVNWTRALHGGRVLEGEWVERMATPPELPGEARTRYGYGLQVSTLGDHRKIAHGGSINGFNASLAYYPDDDLVVAVLANTSGAGTGGIEVAIARAVLGLGERTDP